MTSVVHTIRQLKEDIRDYLNTHNNEAELIRLENALEDITTYHADQIRKSGEPVIIHPLRVAWSICDAGLDAPTIIAALLHDIIEDTIVTKDYIKDRYGDWYAEMVDGLTKIKQAKASKEKQITNQDATYRKMLTTMVKDVRVLFIKLFDRLDNMNDMDSMPRHKQRRISQETYNVYLPLARRLGLQKITQEFGILCFRYLYPLRYQATLEKLKALKHDRQSAIQNMIQILLDKLHLKGLDHVGVSPIFVTPDAYIKSIDVDRILDGVRILVSEPMLTYMVLGALHTEFSAIPLKIRDFISNPRWDGYRGLQTEILIEGEMTAIEITTRDMHAANWHGIMGHWTGTPTELADYYRAYLDQIDHMVGEKELRMDDVLRYSQAEQVQVFTPKGDFYFFPKGATVLDFAYAIHTELGNTCKGALVNSSAQDNRDTAKGKRVPRERQLINGERVQIITGSSIKPMRTWLPHVMTGKARAEIQRSIRQQNAARVKQVREDAFRSQLRSIGEEPDKFITSTEFVTALQEDKLTWEDFLESYGTNKRRISKFLTQHALITPNRLERTSWPKRIFNPFFDNSSPGITIEDINDPLIRFAECCSPLPNDKALGVLTEQQEMEIHRANCEKIKNSDEQTITVEWKLIGEALLKEYSINLITVNMPGVLFQVTKIIKNMGVGIKDSQSGKVGDDAQININLEPITLQAYHKLLAKIRPLKIVKKIL